MSDENLTPTIDDPTPPPASESSPQERADALLAALKNLGVTEPEQVNNMATASQQAGNYANLLGDMRAKNDELTRMVTELTSSRQNHVSEFDEYGNPKQLTEADIQRIMSRTLEDREAKRAKQLTDFQNQIMAERAAIHNDPDYTRSPEIQKLWAEHENNPRAQQRVMSGQSTVRQEFDNLVKAVFRNQLKKTADMVQTLGSQPGQAKSPHIESGNTTVPAIPNADEQLEKIKNLQKNWSGSDNDVNQLVNTFFDQNDSFFHG